MILSFKTQIENKPTYFIERIWRCLLCKNFNLLAYHKFRDESAYNEVIDQWDFKETLKPKLHTIRQDSKNRWKKGNKIDFFINARKPKMFRFAPVVPVMEIQSIEFLWSRGFVDTVSIYIDGECYVQNYGIEYNSSNQRQERMERLVINDGFESVEDFLNYFNTDFKGKIIHWTNLKY
ncbi:hypothetical protein [Flavobacterium anhuiense]|uniref:hypothetical protein n=1 Tax=Flavobacterium anhuiense TaxID=459526 RepID=UPI000E6BF4F3|nr:hypothetical protein [Flavobacterium anhuiense]